MTEWEALIKCRNHWQWLAITGNSKASYSPARKWMHSCACCEYTSNLEEYDLFLDCNKCPLTGFAWNAGTDLYSFCDRLTNNSVYALWRDTQNKEQKQLAAQKMVDACNRAIEAYILNE